MANDTYRALQKQLDTYSVGFPATTSGVEIELLKYLFTEKDAEMFSALTQMLETASAVAERVNKPVEEVFTQLDDMAERGLLFRLGKGETAKFGTIPFMHGLFEFQVKTLDREFSEMAGRYFEEAFDAAMTENAEYFLRTIPVNESIGVAQNVASYEDAVEILKGKKKIVVTDCICRKRTTMTETGCGKPSEACFMFGSMGEYYLDRDMGRVVSLEEAVEILKSCNEAGLVTQPATSQNPAGMCNCCGDCCGVLAALKKHPEPATKVFSNYTASVDSDECTGCGTCPDRCQMDAITLNAEDVAEINPLRCIGCGLCVTTCPTEAIRLTPKTDTDYRKPPANTVEQMTLMAQKRGLI